MTAYIHDGTTFDLDRAYADVVGIHWTWVGEWNTDGEPLMLGDGHPTPIPLPDVYYQYGPLIPLTPRVQLTGAMVRDAFTGTVIS